MPSNGPNPTRRGFLLAASAGLIGASCLGATPAAAIPFLRRDPPAGERRLLMVHQRTGEVFNEVYRNDDGYHAAALEQFALFARDLRAGVAGDMDPRLLDLVADLQSLAGAEEPLILTHGFRTADTNRRLRNGARNSLHMAGRALDIAHPRLSASALHQHALTLAHGGLGRYRRFIHVDTGPTRRW
ncbi:DUF882 domain-containing protein [Pararhodobacter sp. SW119]|uniref:YcbK family protein n=1 Tax=Pararhodobacter sp. SW119 TaxID=2780075 RepID=UPI001AE0CBD2|nr:DUF882 domain-containing protein [Pararhodobacter sp. SW119]